MNRKAGLLALVSLAGALVCPSAVFGLGIELPDQDAFATARGNAFTATADDNAAVYYNPAGITQLDGSRFSLGAYGIEYSSHYSGAAGSIYSKTEWEVVPQVFSSMSLPYNLTFGLGTYSPYGLRFEWPNSSPFSPMGQMGEVDYIRLNPVFAWKVAGITNLSIAAGAMFDYSEADFKETLPGFNNEFKGRDDAAGFNLGALYQPWQQHSFGITYRSATDMNYNGHAVSLTGPGNIPAQANIHYPQELVFGYSFRPTTNWNLEVDATWSDWTDLRTVNINPQAALGDKLAFNWSPSWILNAGGTYYLGKNWRLSGGFMYVENTVPEADFNALVPDGDRYLFSVGVGQKYDKFSWDVAYQLGIGPSRSVTSANFAPVDGSYSFLSDAITINFGYRF